MLLHFLVILTKSKTEPKKLTKALIMRSEYHSATKMSTKCWCESINIYRYFRYLQRWRATENDSCVFLWKHLEYDQPKQRFAWRGKIISNLGSVIDSMWKSQRAAGKKSSLWVFYSILDNCKKQLWYLVNTKNNL